jgi:hypothetical protein
MEGCENSTARGEQHMPDQPSQPPNDRFKAEMPDIPGLSGPAPKPAGAGGPWLVMVGLVAVLIAVFVGGRILSKTRRAEAVPVTTPQIDVPAPVPDLTASVPVASEQNPVIAVVSELKPWEAKQFNFHNRTTGENVAALIVRLPNGSSAQASGYWSFAMKPAYGNCQLEYIDDLQRLRSDYGYQQARHPMVGNPCNRSLYDPLKYAAIPGGVLARGAVVQGSDLRPPLGIETKMRSKDILAVRME